MYDYDIVIIDSGFDIDEHFLGGGVCIEKKQEDFFVSCDLSDSVGHGTIVYSIISKQFDNGKIFLIKMPNCQDDYNASSLVYALQYVKNNICCKIINISLGLKTSDDLKELYDICSELSAMGCVIVSAFDNEGCNSYPAAFDCVIGVDSKNDIKNIAEFDYIENSQINVLAKGNLQRIKMKDGRILLVGGASMACAYITCVLAKIADEHLNLQKALLYLKSESRYTYISNKIEKQMDNNQFKIKNAVVFPFAKEAHAFLRFADKLSFRISAYCDVRRSGKVGRKLSSYYEGADSTDYIKDIEQVDFKDVDTLILGHLDELNTILGRDYRDELIKKVLEKKLNIYSFDSLAQYEDLFVDLGLKYFYPCVTQCEIPQNSFGKLYKIPKPVVGIFGTSSRQGKFSLQIAVKAMLESRGYNVGTIGTEPHSMLFGFDDVFPMGYNSTVFLQNNQIVLYLNNVINNLCLNGKEIILVASQAQTVPYYCNNILEFPSMQYHFAMGTNPDAIVLCVNYHDEIPYIQNTMYTLMGLTDANIIAFVMYPITYSKDWNGVYGNAKYRIDYCEFEEKATILQEKFNIPVFLLGNQQHMHELCQEIIEFF